MMNTFLTRLEELCSQAGISLSERQKEQMGTLYDVLVKENQKHNLTTVTDPQDAALRHFFDSIIPYKQLRESGRTIDVGSGAGFPVLPLAVMRPDISFSAIESVHKKCTHIELAARAAGLEVTVICGRAEEHRELREAFDDCVTRAVAALPLLVELTAPLVRVGGKVLYYKADYQEELDAAEGGIKKLGLRLGEIVPMVFGDLNHSILIFEKVSPTPSQYPRRYARMKKSPLR